ncbi:MAG: CDP-glucose 4,6-dehydratase [Candidatus Tectimicrobiota bacterium]
MEALGITAFDGVYDGRRVLVTGHTGFKGSWLALWLTALGAQVTGLALPPATSPNHWDLLHLDLPEHRIDIRNAPAVQQAIDQAAPEIIFHLAAQPLVRRSYRDPLETWSSNVMGTANLLQACRDVPTLRAVVLVTTDKVYANREWAWGYRETDRLGGHDPYSASKAASELVVESYRKAFFHAPGAPLLATARAGNVVGGGDWSEDRLIPDLVRAVSTGIPLEIRSPNATRPWQHVLECLGGYLLLGQKLLQGQQSYGEAWNFGPAASDNRTVVEILTHLQDHWPALVWQMTQQPQPHEANLLYLDNAKAQASLGWRPVWSLETALTVTANWYRSYILHGTIESRQQLQAFLTAARAARHTWVNA